MNYACFILCGEGSQHQAHLQKAKILAKEGDFAEAEKELKAYSKVKKNEAEAEQLVSPPIGGTTHGVSFTLMSCGLRVRQAESVHAALGASKSAHKAAKGKKWQQCVQDATKALEVGPNSGSLRLLRIECATELGDVEAVYGDLR